MDELKTIKSVESELTPQQYFEQIKDKKYTVSSDDLKKIYENCLELANKYRITGQIRGLRKILFCMESIEKEQKLVDMGITTFVYKDDIDFYIDTVANTRNRSDRPIKIIELERYEREIPDEIVDVIDKTKELFDQMYVVYTDYTGKEERKIEAEKKEKDPILFGTFQDTLRYGTLDLGELYSRCSNDVGDFGNQKSLALTHCNECDWDNKKLVELFKDWNIYYSDGETHQDIELR